MSTIQIFATDIYPDRKHRKTDGREEITDLYWFEQNYVHDLNKSDEFLFEIVIDGVTVWKSR